MVSSMAVEADHGFKAHADPTRMAAFDGLFAVRAIDHEPNQSLEG
jgi:hypothetical protein